MRKEEKEEEEVPLEYRKYRHRMSEGYIVHTRPVVFFVFLLLSARIDEEHK